jgi:hypothetical protein
VPVAVRGRAESMRVQVDGLQAGGQGAGHVIPEAVADVQDGAAGRHAEGVQRQVEDGGIRLGHADHGGVDDHADRDSFWCVRLLCVRLLCVRLLAVGGVADAEAAQFGLYGAVGIRDHAHGQAECGQGLQPGYGPGADVRPGAAHGGHGDLGGQLAALVVGHAAGGEVADQVLTPPGARGGRYGGHVLNRHRLVVGPLEPGDIRGDADLLQRRQQEIGLREDHDPACVEQDCADPRAHIRTIRAGPRQSCNTAWVWAVSSVPR